MLTLVSIIVALLILPTNAVLKPFFGYSQVSVHSAIDKKLAHVTIPFGYPQNQAGINPCGPTYNNWDFEAGDLRCWTQQKSPAAPPPVVVPPGSGGNPFSSNAVLLGDPSGTTVSALGTNGFVRIQRSFQVPAISNPVLEFEYLMYSYDIIASSTFPYDTLEVAINNPSNVKRTYGNPTPNGSGCLPNRWQSSPVPQTDTIDLAPFAGTVVTVYFTLYNQTDNLCNSWAYIDNIRLLPETTLTKTNTPSGPLHEGDVITYTLAYANTSLITQTMTLSDVLPFNVNYLLGSAYSPPDLVSPFLSWDLGDLPPNTSGSISFQANVALLPQVGQLATSQEALSSSAPAHVLPVPVACDTTRFWANGVTRQPPLPNPHTIKMQIPPASNPSMMWLLMKHTNNISPEVDSNPAILEKTVENEFGASLWTTPITPAMVAAGEVTVVTRNPRNLNAIFFFDVDDPPFEQAILDDFYQTTKTATYTLNIPSVATQTIDIILPFMDITYWTDGRHLEPDTRATDITVEFNGQHHTATFTDPNMGNGLLMAQFPFEIGPLPSNVMTKTVTVTVDTEDSVYTLGPRICRPVYVENTAWLCSQQAGCVSDSARNVPNNFSPAPTSPIAAFLPIILKSS